VGGLRIDIEGRRSLPPIELRTELRNYTSMVGFFIEKEPAKDKRALG